MDAGAPAGFHAIDAAAVAERLGTDPSAGLTEHEAAARLRLIGRNTVADTRARSVPQLLVGQFADPLVLILLVAAIISGTMLGEVLNAGVILAIVALNAGLGFVQQYRAESALARLREMAAPLASAIRQGRQRRLPAANLVPGDLVVLHAGDRVPADARVVAAQHLATGEAMLTGEPFPQDKSTTATPDATPLADRTSMLYMGTAVVTGRGLGIVTATGRATAIGEIAGLLTSKPQRTRLQRELAGVGRVIGVAALVVVGGMFLIGWLQGYPAEVMFLTSVALAVAVVPEGLPAVVTITLARGVQRLAQKRALVRRLEAVETLGAASVVCTDKTGTLTRNRIEVQEIVLAGSEGGPVQLDRSDGRAARYAQVAALCNDADASGGGGDPLEVALLRSLEPIDVQPQALRSASPRLDEIAFDARRKLMTTLHRLPDGPAGYMLAVKGAPEAVLRRSARVEGATGPEPLTEDGKARFAEVARSMASGGLRTLALAYRPLEAPLSDLRTGEQDLILVGVAGFKDEVREEAAPAVRIAQEAGIRVVMVTGDHPATASAVAREVGILEPGQEVLGGDRLTTLSSEELRKRAHRYSVFARVDPVDKVKIVQAWQARGAVVAMTGDGVNDAPALRTADIGVAMGSGTDVSREASAIVLADDNFATLVSAVREGRTVFGNLHKVVCFLLTTNATEVLVMAAGFLLFGQIGQPLLATQILWINLVTDGPPVLALGAGPPVRDVMRRPPNPRGELVGAPVLWSLGWCAGVLAAATLGTLFYGHYLADDSWPRVQTLVFTTLVTVQLTYAFGLHALDRSTPLQGSKALVVATVASLALQLAAIYVPLCNVLFSTVPLSVRDWAVIAGVNILALGAVRLVHSVRPADGHRQLPSPKERALARWRQVPIPMRKAAAAVVGGVLIGVGTVMLVLPGPGLVAIGLGLAVLATEFALPRRLLQVAAGWAQRHLRRGRPH